MGAFIGIKGKAVIPAEKEQEFSNRILEIFKAGGMMEVEHVQIYGRKMPLLSMPEIKYIMQL